MTHSFRINFFQIFVTCAFIGTMMSNLFGADKQNSSAIDHIKKNKKAFHLFKSLARIDQQATQGEQSAVIQSNNAYGKDTMQQVENLEKQVDFLLKEIKDLKKAKQPNSSSQFSLGIGQKDGGGITNNIYVNSSEGFSFLPQHFAGPLKNILSLLSQVVPIGAQLLLVYKIYSFFKELGIFGLNNCLLQPSTPSPAEPVSVQTTEVGWRWGDVMGAIFAIGKFLELGGKLF